MVNIKTFKDIFSLELNNIVRDKEVEGGVEEAGSSDRQTERLVSDRQTDREIGE